jgi:hypothetical protein
MQDAAAAELLAPLPPAERFATWHVAFPDGTLVGRGTGGVVLLRTLRRTRGIGYALEFAPDRALDAAYDLIAHHRQWLGRIVPDHPGPRRYP